MYLLDVNELQIVGWLNCLVAFPCGPPLFTNGLNRRKEGSLLDMLYK